MSRTPRNPPIAWPEPVKLFESESEAWRALLEEVMIVERRLIAAGNTPVSFRRFRRDVEALWKIWRRFS